MGQSIQPHQFCQGQRIRSGADALDLFSLSKLVKAIALAVFGSAVTVAQQVEPGPLTVLDTSLSPLVTTVSATQATTMFDDSPSPRIPGGGIAAAVVGITLSIFAMLGLCAVVLCRRRHNQTGSVDEPEKDEPAHDSDDLGMTWSDASRRLSRTGSAFTEVDVDMDLTVSSVIRLSRTIDPASDTRTQSTPIYTKISVEDDDYVLLPPPNVLELSACTEKSSFTSDIEQDGEDKDDDSIAMNPVSTTPYESVTAPFIDTPGYSTPGRGPTNLLK